jgi:hypothetical protein
LGRASDNVKRIKTYLTKWLPAVSAMSLFWFTPAVRSATEMPSGSFNITEHASEAAVDETAPAAASNGENSLVVWKDNRHDSQPYHQGHYLLYGRRFDLKGRPLDAVSFSIQNEPFTWNNEGITLPTVTALGRDYLVVWITPARHIQARRVLSNGTVTTNEIVIAQTGHAAGQPAVAVNRRGALIVWTDRLNNNGDIYATLVNKKGEVKRVLPIVTNSANAQYPVVATVGDDFLVLWRELVPFGEGLVKAAFVNQDGEVRLLDSFPSSLADRVLVASNGRNYLVAKQVFSAQTGQNDLIGSVLNSRGAVLKDGLPLALGTGSQIQPALLPNGRSFTMLWRENPYAPEATLHALPISACGTAQGEAAAFTAEAGWSGYGQATGMKCSQLMVVLEQKTPDYSSNGYLSRIRGNLVERVR